MSTDPSNVYAVIRSGGKQYRVSPGQRITLERLDGDAGDAISFDDVLLVSGGGEVAVGTPTVAAASVSGEIVEQGRGRKINVFKYKSKTRYRRLRGHRQLHTSVLVNEVALGDQVWSAPAQQEFAADAAEPEIEEADQPAEALEESEAEAVAEIADEQEADPTDGVNDEAAESGEETED